MCLGFAYLERDRERERETEGEGKGGSGVVEGGTLGGRAWPERRGGRREERGRRWGQRQRQRIYSPDYIPAIIKMKWRLELVQILAQANRRQ